MIKHIKLYRRRVRRLRREIVEYEVQAGLAKAIHKYADALPNAVSAEIWKAQAATYFNAWQAALKSKEE